MILLNATTSALAQASLIDFYGITWNSIDWIYGTFQSLYAYNLIAKSCAYASWLFDNDHVILSQIMMRWTVSLHGFEFVISSLFDNFLRDILLKCELSEDNFRRLIGLIDPTMFAVFHPDSIHISKSVNSGFAISSFIKFQLAVLDYIEKNSLLVPLNYSLQLMLSFFILCIFVIFFCSFFSNNKEEAQSDADYSVSSLSAEAEKELFSIDDVTCLFLLLFFVFAAYFGFFAMVVNIHYVEFLTFFAAIPFVVGVLLLMPCNLIFDFGLLFVAYLRGVANTSSFFFELIYDYIGIAAFFTRLAVQFVRLILMFVVYCMMHDTVVLFTIPMRSWVFGDSFWDELCAIKPTLRSVSFFFLLVLPARAGYWVYEVLHTFFVVTVQFTAFFTIIFWLFLLFYTFFVFEEYECYFIDLRKVTERLQDEILKAKEFKKNKPKA